MTNDFRWGNLPPDVPQTPYNRLKAVMPFIWVAVEAAKHEVPDGEIGLGILVTRPDGSVKFTAAMSAENFASDLEEVLGQIRTFDEVVHAMESEADITWHKDRE